VKSSQALPLLVLLLDLGVPSPTSPPSACSPASSAPSAFLLEAARLLDPLLGVEDEPSFAASPTAPVVASEVPVALALAALNPPRGDFGGAAEVEAATIVSFVDCGCPRLGSKAMVESPV